MIKTCKQILVLLIATCSADSVPGLGGSVNQAGVSSLTSIVTPYIFANIKDINIPEIDFDGGNLKNIDINIPAPTSYDDIDLNLVNSDNAVELVANNLQAKLVCDFTYKYIVTVSGKATITIKKMNADLELALSTQPGTPATDLAPKITADKVAINISPDDIDIDLSGSLVSKIASVFIPFFKSTLIPMIVDDLTSQVKTIIDTTVDQDLAKYGTQAEIPYLAGVTFDYGQMNDGIKISSDKILSGALNGTFFDANQIQASKYAPTPFKVRDPNGKMLQAYMSDYVLNTMFESGFLTGNSLDITYLLQKYFNVTVVTCTLHPYIPELMDQYGCEHPVSITGAFTKKQTESKFTEKGQSISGTLQVNFTVDTGNFTETAIIAEFDDFNADAVLHAEKGSLFGKISNLSAGTVTGFNTTLVNMTAEHLHQEIQGTFDSAVSQANQNLTAGIVIPKVMGIDVSDLDLKFFDGYAEFGISVDAAFWNTVWDLAQLPRHIPEEIENIGIDETISFLQ